MIDLDAPVPDRPQPPGGSRGFALILAVAVCLATLHSVPGGERTVRTLWTAPPARTLNIQAGPDTVWALRVVDASGGELTAYEMATGRVRWTRPAAATTAVNGGFSVLPAAGILLVDDLAVDAATGAALWRVPGVVDGHDTGTVLVREPDALRLVAARDGTTIWRRPMDGTRVVRIQPRNGRPSTIVVGTGELTLLRYHDGAELLSRPIPRDGDLLAGDGHIVLLRYGISAFSIVGYRPDTLAESWRIETVGGAVQECGPVLCLSGSHGVTGIDPVTGTSRWTLPPGYGAGAVTGDRIVVTRQPRNSGEGRQPLISMVDASSGRRIGAEVAGHPIVSSTGGGRLLVIRSNPQPVAPASVFTLDAATGSSRLIGSVDYQLLNAPYELAGRHLLRLRDGRLEVMTVG
ncbi:MAG TPA: hypothetical protein VN408_22570 [Actinoplanes sp.]|nr:hypothetical protein [Actinoplanes sp.]